jgi:5-bromo-4-chloroindolyl phosphate hydrolysis protein
MIKAISGILPSFIKATIGVIAFVISLGWLAAITIQLTVKSEVAQAKAEMRELRDTDMGYIRDRLDRQNQKLDNITNILIHQARK